MGLEDCGFFRRGGFCLAVYRLLVASSHPFYFCTPCLKNSTR